MDGERELRIVLLGKTGVGKSSVGNTLLGERVFEDSCSPQSQTQICQRYETEIRGRRIVIVDTPGISDTSRNEQRTEILFQLAECAPGPHVIILVLDVSRQTREHQDAVNDLLENFTGDVVHYMILLFTHGYDLNENMTIHDFINDFSVEGKKTLKDLAEKCGNRVHVIDNTHWNQKNRVSSVLVELEKLQLPEQTIKEITEKMQSEQTDETPWFNVLSEERGVVETGSRDEMEERSGTEYRSNRFQMAQLMKSINTILIKTLQQPYKNKSLEKALEAINREVNQILEELDDDEKERENMVEIRRRAIERVKAKKHRLLLDNRLPSLASFVLFAVGGGLVALVSLIWSFWRRLSLRKRM